MTEAIARYGKSQGDQVARHPRLLNLRENLPAEKTTETLTQNLHEWKLPFQPGGNKSTPRKQDSASRDLGSFPNSEGRHHWWNGKNGLKKEERHNRDDSAYDQARREPVPSHNLQENSQARFFQLDTTTARRNQPVKRRSVLRQAPRGRGKRRPAQAR